MCGLFRCIEKGGDVSGTRVSKVSALHRGKRAEATGIDLAQVIEQEKLTMSQDENRNNNNVIQFPGRKREEAKPEAAVATPAAAPQATAPETVSPKRKRKASKKTLAGTVLAVILASGAVNRYVFETKIYSTEFISTSESAGRGIASVSKFARDSRWEKELAERLASPTTRGVASTHIGRSATKEEKLRWGTLEEKYTITYKADSHRIHSILLQGESADPSYILDRAKFLREYGPLFESNFESAKLRSVESNNEKTVEAYTIYDREKRATSEARFELDRHKRLISLKVEPVQI